MAESDSKLVCTVCGLPLPGGEASSRCPHCLLHLALADDLEAPLPPARENESGPRMRYFGDFELVEKIAQGGMGVVWRARQLTVNRVVALKMIHAGHLASAEARVRFAAEIEATAHLDHPHIIPLYETGEHDGVHFFTMKLLAGGDLTARRAALALPATEGGVGSGREWRERQARVVGLVLKISRAVHYAHRRGILHRDLKPSNVLLDESGEPHVADFGLAKMLTRESGFTFTQTVLGSPNYMAPEQALGKTAELTTATDVYGLGAIFYDLLTGRPPFRAESPVATLRQVLDAPPVPPRRINPGIDADLETICIKCLEKSPAGRYASAEALADDLARWLERRPIQARRARAVEHAWRWCQRQPALASALAACTLLVLVVAIGSSIAALRIRRAEQATRAALREARVSEARSLRLTSEIGHRGEGLRLLRAAAQPGVSEEFRRRLRDEWLATLVRTDLEFSPLPALQPARVPAFNLVAPRFDRLASLIDSNSVVVRELPSGKLHRQFQLESARGARLEQFSHDGRFLGLRTPDGIGIWEVDSGQCLWRTNGPQRVFGFAPDRSEMVVEEWGCQATVLSLPDLGAVRTVHAAPSSGAGQGQGWSALALSPGRRTLVVARAGERVTEWIDLAKDHVFRRTTNRAAVVTLAWSPEGARLAMALANGRIPVFDANGRQVFDLPSTRVSHNLAFNADGSLLAAQGRDRVLRLIDTQAMRMTFEALCDASVLTFDPAGTRLGPIFRGEDFGAFEIRRPAEFHHVTVAATRTELDDCRYSPDGRIVAVGNAAEVVLCFGDGRGRLGSRPDWRIGACAFDPAEPFVYAATPAGVLRWSIKSDAASSFELQGKEPVLPGRGWRSLAFAEDGSCFVAANIYSNAVVVLDRTLTNRLATLGPLQAPNTVALSPEGRWAATGSATDRQVRIWDVASGNCARVLSAGADPHLAFSRDGRWFVTSGDAFQLLSVGSWESAPSLPFPENRPLLGAAAFSPDSTMLAVVCDESAVQLIDLQNFRRLGRLQMPGTASLHAIQFAPDSTRLAGVGNLGRLHFWDLVRIRQSLEGLSLDWDWPRRQSLEATP